MSSDSFASTDDSSTESTTDRSTAHIGLICTHALELKSLIGRLDRRRRYIENKIQFSGGFLEQSIRVAVVEAGAGFAAHRQATSTLIAEHKPGWVISTGFSSSLSDDVTAGDLCLANAIHDTHGQKMEVSCPIPESKHTTVRTHLVADAHPRSASEKRRLAEQSGADAVDTNSLAVAQVCAETSTKFLSIRAIIDDVREELPAAGIEFLFEPIPAGRGNPLSRWVGGLRQPAEIKACQSRAATASGRLDQFLTGVIRQLMPSGW